MPICHFSFQRSNLLFYGLNSQKWWCSRADIIFRDPEYILTAPLVLETHPDLYASQLKDTKHVKANHGGSKPKKGIPHR